MKTVDIYGEYVILEVKNFLTAFKNSLDALFH